jgi:hypothetical protein
VVTLSHRGGEWMGWTLFIGILILGNIMVTMSILKAASDSDDQMMGDRQYYE